MSSIFLAQWMKEKRSPILVLAFTLLSIVATLLFGSGMESKIKVNVFPEQGLEAGVFDEWIKLLNDNESIEFVKRDEKQARVDVSSGRIDAAIKIMDDNYQIIASVDNPNVQLVEHYAQTVFVEELQLRTAAKFTGDEAALREAVQQPALAVQLQTPDGRSLVSYNMSIQLLFTFTLFLVMFTIGYKINAITMEKVSGIWSRIVLSPIKKVEMYMGHLLYSTIIGFIQIAVVLLLFQYAFHFDLGSRFGMLLVVAALYIMTIVSFCMLLTGILRTPEQFNMVFPSIIPIMPLLSGAYMPPGTITNKVLLAIAEAFPLKHALDTMVAISIYDADWSQIFISIAKLLLIAVLCMGLGINLMERRKDGYR